MKKQSGLTLVELLVVTAIFTVISLAIYATFSSGLKIWEKVNQPLAEEGVGIFLDKIAYDLRNSFRFQGINFMGQEQELAFASIVNSPRLQKRTVGEVIYSYDAGSGVLTRQEKDFSHIYSDEEGVKRNLLSRISNLKFRYYAYNKEKKEYFWLDKVIDEELPSAVRIELELKDAQNKFTKTIEIPLAD